MQTFDWTLLQSFLSVAETGSYSAAARAIGRSQPTIGRHIEQLQTQLGAVLFQRATSGYTLTPTGTALVDHARTMQAAAAKISLITEGQAEELRGTVRVTASEIVATYILPELLAELLDQEPELQIELVATNSSENLSMREADIAVRMVQPDQQDLIARKLGEIEIGLFTAQPYLDRKGTPKGLEDFADHIVLGYDKSDLIIRGMAEFGMQAKREDFAFRIDNQVAYLEAIRAGVGIGASQRRQAERYNLIEVMPELKLPSLPVWLAAHTELRTSARVRRVFDFLADHLPARL
ncbi:LysR family transcriptional regulator [Amylibacter sp. IMCC11727]|uniref:LysR family transcriptional regulator n=1 Tax=Amylibacter sp. IMCC11727 TaxID=3039851 RepID=UPI00244DA1B0|nr:LysR family transcriptional regulator [Amylibacter sp. IMCC11727]WGI22196.1 LysR family transcriptional regulator [Amylibacter sp. IMCC11727]